MPRLERASSHGSPSLVLSGFPRTADQLTMLQRVGLGEPHIIHLDLSRGAAERKLADRRVCTRCGEAMHPLPPVEGAPTNAAALYAPVVECASDCDAPTPVRTAADETAAVHRRLDAYDAQTVPLLERLRKRGAVTDVVVREGSGDFGLSFGETWADVERACGLEPLDPPAPAEPS
jgi:adenylate kinase family enzyme